MSGVQLAWALQTAWATALFLQQYDVGIRSIGAIRIAGPLAGLIVQPIAGVLADGSADRRVLLVLGVALMVGSMLLLPNANVFFSRGVALRVAIGSLWALDIGMNVAMLVMRAIVTAHFPSREQTHGQALLASAASAGQLIGFLLSTLSLSSLGFCSSDRDVAALFAIGAMLLLCSTAITLACATPRLSAGAAPRVVLCEPFAVLHAFAFWSLPRWLRGVCAVTFCSWLCWFAHVLLLAHWVGQDIFGGEAAAADPGRARAYASGVHFAAAGSALQAATAALMGAGVLQLVVKARGLRFALAAALLLQAALSCGTCAISALRVRWLSKALALGAIGLLGASWAASSSLPFAIVGERAPRAEVGVLLGKLNIYVVLAQVVVSLLIPLTSTLPAGARAWGPLFAGGLCALVGAGLVPLVEESRPGATSRRPHLAQPLIDGASDSVLNLGGASNATAIGGAIEDIVDVS